MDPKIKNLIMIALILVTGFYSIDTRADLNIESNIANARQTIKRVTITTDGTNDGTTLMDINTGNGVNRIYMNQSILQLLSLYSGKVLGVDANGKMIAVPVSGLTLDQGGFDGNRMKVGTDDIKNKNPNGNIGIGGAPEAGTKIHVRTTKNNPDQLELLLDEKFPGNSSMINFRTKTNDATRSLGSYNDSTYFFLGKDGTKHITVLNSGNVGIGTTSPTQKLDVNGNVRVQTLTSKVVVGTDSTGVLTGSTSGAVYNYISGFVSSLITSSSSGYWTKVGSTIYNTNTGNVGIGTTSPKEKLEVSGGNVRITNLLNKIVLGTNGNGVITGSTSGNVYNYISGYMNSSFLSINSGYWIKNGSYLYNTGDNIGIGTATPTSGKVQIKSSANTQLVLEETSATNAANIHLINGADVRMLGAYADRFYIGRNGVAFVNINTEGKVGIGTADQIYTLEVHDGDADAGVFIGGRSDRSSLKLGNKTDNTKNLRDIYTNFGDGALYFRRNNGGTLVHSTTMNKDGNVGIRTNTSMPKVALQVSGNFIAGAYNNNAASIYSSIGGGKDNRIIGGVDGNSFIGAGEGNSVTTGADWSFIGGGYFNTLDNSTLISSIVGGDYNTIIGGRSDFIGGGDSNAINDSPSSVIGGGGNNTITGQSLGSFIGGGSGNLINDNSYKAFIGGGETNTIFTMSNGSIGGGKTNTMNNGENGTIGGGYHNTMNGSNNGTIGGGYHNTIDSVHDGFIGGGSNNSIGLGDGGNSSIVGGANNSASGDWNSIGGGQNNALLGTNNFIGGGAYNSTRGGNAYYSSIVGGKVNNIQGEKNFIGGGEGNRIQNSNSTYNNIVGGYTNIVNNSTYSSIVGGSINTINRGTKNFIGGGQNNIISGTLAQYSSIIGGFNNKIINSKGSFVGGINAQIPNVSTWGVSQTDHTFIWNSDPNVTFSASGFTQMFLINAPWQPGGTGGVGINTNAPKASLDVHGTVIIDQTLYVVGAIESSSSIKGNTISVVPQPTGMGNTCNTVAKGTIIFSGSSFFGCNGTIRKQLD